MARPIHYEPSPPKLGPDAHEELERLLQALHEHGVQRASTWKPDGNAAPGVGGVYRMLHDDALWNAPMPLVEGLKALAAGLGRDVDKPISAFSGKRSGT